MKHSIRAGIIAASLLLIVLAMAFSTANAASTPQQVTPTPSAPAVTINSDKQCLDCHSKPDQIKDLPNGEQLYLTIDGTAFAGSKHGKASIGCFNCHSNITAFPHPPAAFRSLRQVAYDFSQSCKTCHPNEATKQTDSIHNQLHLKGNDNTATCSDCHNPHYTQSPNTPRANIPNACVKCHSRIVAEYKESVHGTALVKDDNADVPSCITCHGVHNIADPRTTKFLLNSPQLCASCHTDKIRMSKYGLNMDVYNSYVADFHGTTVTLFEQRAPDQLPNKPLCIDCHGTHKISSVRDPKKGLEVKENLLATCQKCHPGASVNFPDAWLSHYDPSPQHNPLVFYVNLFYQFFIPSVIGGMLVFVLADMGNRIVKRVRGTSH